MFNEEARPSKSPTGETPTNTSAGSLTQESESSFRKPRPDIDKILFHLREEERSPFWDDLEALAEYALELETALKKILAVPREHRGFYWAESFHPIAMAALRPIPELDDDMKRRGYR